MVGIKTNEARPLQYIHLANNTDALNVLQRIGVDPYGIEAMLPKMTGMNVLLSGIACKVANIIKQEMLSIGGDAAVSRGAIDCSVPAVDVIIIGSVKQIRRFAEKARLQPFGLQSIANDIINLIDNRNNDHYLLKTSRREIAIGERTLIMGILNVTPDSFSDGGLYANHSAAVERGLQMIEEGADILDIGGESSRPGAESVSPEEELNRVIPVINALAEKTNIPISIDTTKAVVADEAIGNGAEFVNDISAMRFDGKMASVVSSTKAAIILMHMLRTPKDMQQGDIKYRYVSGDIVQFLRQQVDFAESSGIDPEKIMIDPGIGFGKTVSDNLSILKHLAEFKALGKPVLTGVSRKSFIGQLAGGTPAERLEGTAAAVTTAIINGSNVIRVHDVKMMKKVAIVADALLRA